MIAFWGGFCSCIIIFSTENVGVGVSYEVLAESTVISSRNCTRIVRGRNTSTYVI